VRRALKPKEFGRARSRSTRHRLADKERHLPRRMTDAQFAKFDLDRKKLMAAEARQSAAIREYQELKREFDDNWKDVIVAEVLAEHKK
jgi:hypothetical protein